MQALVAIIDNYTVNGRGLHKLAQLVSNPFLSFVQIKLL